MTPRPASGWLQLTLRRIVTLWPLKAMGTTAFMFLFFWGYFGVQQNPLGTPFTMPLTRLDQAIAFTPWAYGVYVSLWVYVSLPPALLGQVRPLLQYGLWATLMCLFCLGIFWLFPTVTPPFQIDWLAYPELGLIKQVDTGGNACPSLHVASAVFSACWFMRLWRELQAPAAVRWLSVAHCVAIVWSTIAIRQHVVWDAVAGVAVGLVFAALSLRHMRHGARPQSLRTVSTSDLNSRR
ncbi:MAG TPA: phosphatase PAP2 family protein [Macromonas sp.]|nr:phosphatase PAP2 family protein [Macromonas sp.]